MARLAGCGSGSRASRLPGPPVSQEPLSFLGNWDPLQGASSPPCQKRGPQSAGGRRGDPELRRGLSPAPACPPGASRAPALGAPRVPTGIPASPVRTWTLFSPHEAVCSPPPAPTEIHFHKQHFYPDGIFGSYALPPVAPKKWLSIPAKSQTVAAHGSHLTGRDREAPPRHTWTPPPAPGLSPSLAAPGRSLPATPAPTPAPASALGPSPSITALPGASPTPRDTWAPCGWRGCLLPALHQGHPASCSLLRAHGSPSPLTPHSCCLNVASSERPSWTTRSRAIALPCRHRLRLVLPSPPSFKVLVAMGRAQHVLELA